MAREVQEFTCTIPAGTQPSAPVVVPMPLTPRIVRRIEVRIPPGPRGTVGFRLGLVQRQLIPYNAGGWIIGDDQALGWDLEGMPSSGAWQLQGYNQGQFNHSIEVRFLLDIPGEGPGLGDPLLALDQLQPPGALSQAEAESAQLIAPPSG